MGQMLPFGLPSLPLPDLFSMHTHPVNFAILQLLLTIPVLYCGRHFFTGGFQALFHGNPNMDSLVAIGSACSFAYSVVMTFLISDDPHAYVHNLYYESAAVVLTLVSLGKFLESRNMQKTKGAITALMQLSPDTAILADSGREVPTSQLKTGDLVLVKPGARIPADGTVTQGESSVNEAMLTGESLPVEKTAGSEVIGGSVNLNGVLYVQVTRTGEDTTLARIIRFVEDAQGKKAPISKTADKVAGVFVPTVMGIALLAAIAWAVAGQPFSFVLRVFTSVLVIACPCALGLATPTAIMVGTGLGARHGILIRSGEILEITHSVDTVVLDKTGTVTEGTPAVTEVLPFQCPRRDVVGHRRDGGGRLRPPPGPAPSPAMQSSRALMPPPVQSVLRDPVRPGHPGRAGGTERSWPATGGCWKRRGVDISPLEAQAQTAWQLKARPPCTLRKTASLLGLISVADPVKETSADAIARMKDPRASVRCSSPATTEPRQSTSAPWWGWTTVIAEVLPEEKAGVVQDLQKQGRTVMMVGDGINDAPALTTADVGCAIGSGSDIAIESADIVLMRSDLEDVSRAIRLSRLTLRDIKQNLFWAFCYNTIGIPIAAGVLYLLRRSPALPHVCRGSHVPELRVRGGQCPAAGPREAVTYHFIYSGMRGNRDGTQGTYHGRNALPPQAPGTGGIRRSHQAPEPDRGPGPGRPGHGGAGGLLHGHPDPSLRHPGRSQRLFPRTAGQSHPHLRGAGHPGRQAGSGG